MTNKILQKIKFSDTPDINYIISDPKLSEVSSVVSGLNSKINISIGSVTQPIYFNNGAPSACTYTLEKSVPANAIFTDTTYSIMTSTNLGLGKVFSDTKQITAANSVTTTTGRTYGVQLNDSDQLVVNVPWTDTDTTYSIMTSTSLGLGKVFSDIVQTTAANTVTTTTGRTYGIQLNNAGQLVVNVPWTDNGGTGPTYGVMTSTSLGLGKVFSDTTQAVDATEVYNVTGRTYGVQLNSKNQLVVNVPWTDTNTTYSIMTSTSLGLGKVFSDTVQTTAANSVTTTTGRTYGVQLNNAGQLVVNVPWTDNGGTGPTYGVMTSTSLGLGKVFSDTKQITTANTVTTTTGRTYGVQLNDSNQLVVNVPWTDTDTTYDVMTSSKLGLGKVFSNTTQTVNATEVYNVTGRTYGVQLNNSNQLVVNVPWTDTNTTYSIMTSTSLGLGKVFSNTVQTTAANSVTTTTGRTYGVQLNNAGQLVVNVPWTDTDTTYDVMTSSKLGLGKVFSNTVQTTAAKQVTDTADRTYGIQRNSLGQLVVNVPWTNTTKLSLTSITNNSTVYPDGHYKIIMTGDTKLYAAGGSTNYTGASEIFINPGSYTFSGSENLILVNALQPNKMNYCTLNWYGTTCRMYVVDSWTE